MTPERRPDPDSCPAVCEAMGPLLDRLGPAGPADLAGVRAHARHLGELLAAIRREAEAMESDGTGGPAARDRLFELVAGASSVTPATRDLYRGMIERAIRRVFGPPAA